MFLRPEQTELVKQLQRRSQLLADIYTGGLQVLADERNPTRFQLAAHAFRELISHCSELTGIRVVYGDGMKQRLVPLMDAFAAWRRSNASTANPTGEPTGIPVPLIEALEQFLDWTSSNRAGARKKTARLLAQLAGAGPVLPSDVVAEDISGWVDSDNYFKLVAHHQRAAERDEFAGKLFVTEDVLLRRIQPRPVSDLDEIDRLIEKGENGNG
jgi:hypothetical protein